jgi:predicted RNase H-like HicB family nuclease
MATEGGYSGSCPGLPGRWSQGVTGEEALANIQEAVREHVEVAGQPASGVPKIAGIARLRAVRALETGGGL